MLRLQTILPPKMPFFVRQKVQISSKILPQIPKFAPISSDFVKNQYFRHDGQFSSFCQFLVKNEILWSQRPPFDSRVVPLFHSVATLGKLFAHIASPVSQLQETGVQKGVFGA